ncbi:hypothetical protein HOLleu_13360 [Holothuria leucospilota]|uniref:Uncharacterized protein n=1 Tax=Holothuria leucospilota TaxID=206669 RepID=A0A9Q1CCV2_HOLLE|nr:hypothetical protein HOLleu_13360 [Holothuria leucospilota]
MPCRSILHIYKWLLCPQTNMGSYPQGHEECLTLHVLYKSCIIWQRCCHPSSLMDKEILPR